jgi:hypothetical protein
VSSLINNGSLLFSGIWAFCETIVIFTVAFRFFSKMIKRLDRIEYALYNDGQTGLINKVDALIENQQIIKTEVEIIKVRIDK